MGQNDKEIDLVDQLIERVKPEVKAGRGFAIIAVDMLKDGKDGFNMGLYSCAKDRKQILVAVARALGLDPLVAINALIEYAPSKVKIVSPFASDLKKKDE